jgi:hypothetical protein
MLHADFGALACGLVYWLLVPSCFIFLQIYMITNINDVTWGTRTGVVVKKSQKDSVFTYIKEMEIVGLQEIFRTIWYGPDKSRQDKYQMNPENISGDFVPENAKETTESEGMSHTV